VDFYDSGGFVRPPPAGLDREGFGDWWPCSVCQQQRNRDPAGRELWEGAAVEAATAGSRLFVDAVVVKVRQPTADEFGDLDPTDKVRSLGRAVLRKTSVGLPSPFGLSLSAVRNVTPWRH
jgi:hypothetical protein